MNERKQDDERKLPDRRMEGGEGIRVNAHVRAMLRRLVDHVSGKAHC